MTDAETQIQTVIVGLGKTGLSCARFLTRRGMAVIVVDSRLHPPGADELRAELPRIAMRFGGFDAGLFRNSDLLVVSPGISIKTPEIAEAVAAGVDVIGDIELFARYAKAPVIAITGSNGKSTVTTLMGEMAERAGKSVRVGGNIGTPALDLIQNREPDLYVLELSSFQLETTHSLAPASAVVLNVSQDHLDRYDGMGDYALAKKSIYNRAQHCIVNRDDPVVAGWGGALDGAVSFGLEAPEAGQFGVRQHHGQAWLAKGEQLLMPASELKIAGAHNVANVLAALALGEAVGLSMEAMLEAAGAFAGLPHRCQWLAEADSVNWYNDSKATNVGAAVAAIAGMPGKVVLLAGGEGKGQDFAPLRDVLAAKGRALVLFGRDAGLIDTAVGHAVVTETVASLKEAVLAARRLAEPGDAVLLAPACASFDMFKGYEDRGNQFAAVVREVLA